MATLPPYPGEYIPRPPGDAETADRTEPYTYHVFPINTYLFLHKGSTLWLLFGVSELLASLLWSFGAVIK